MKSGKVCLSIHNSSLANGSAIRLVDPSLPQEEIAGKIAAADASCSSEGATETDIHYYRVRTEGAATLSTMPAIAISGFSSAFRRQGELLAADIDHDGREEFFRSCTSSEGIHFTVWSGKPLDGQARWHQYFYLGYDVDPTCTPKEVEPR